MDVRVEELSATAKKITITVDAKTVNQRLEKSYASLAKEVKLPGFRKGKVPRKVLEERFGPETAKQTANELVADLLHEVIASQQIELAGDPEVEQRALHEGQPFEFSATVEVKPKVKLSDLDGLKVTMPTVEVSDDDVEAHLQAMLRQTADIVESPADQPADEGYVANVTLTLRTEGYPDHELEHLQVGLPDDRSTDFVVDLVRGLKTGESRSGNVEVPVTYPDPIWAGASCEATVEVKLVSKIVVPELDEAFAKKVGHESVDSMRGALKDALSAAMGQRAQAHAERELIEQVIEKNVFEVPASMVESRAKVLLRAIASELMPGTARQQPSLDDLEEDKRADLMKEAEFAVRRELILQAVADDEKLVASVEERAARMADIAQQTGQSVDTIRSYMENAGGMKALDARIVEEKASALLLARASQGD
ncbi:MAG: trigger factor [Deltaproteobacteria bacterium]|jgi:trigger factor|nr:trigger factor [Deltaproteobacteria bacterium]MBW2534296.1 trigger factor [Deltaproteobacteria bacterium]